MTELDIQFIKTLLGAGVIGDPVLELGVGYGGVVSKELVESSGRRYFSTDLFPTASVDMVADFETGDGVQEVARVGPYGTVLVLNVLEHTFDPVAVLDNALKILATSGSLVVVAPAVWPLHSHPIDCCRLLPDWFRKFAQTRHLSILEDYFSYVGFGPISAFRGADGHDRFPEPAAGAPAWRLYSRTVHRVFNTFGRTMWQPSHIVIGAVLVRSVSRR